MIPVGGPWQTLDLHRNYGGSLDVQKGTRVFRGATNRSPAFGELSGGNPELCRFAAGLRLYLLHRGRPRTDNGGNNAGLETKYLRNDGGLAGGGHPPGGIDPVRAVARARSAGTSHISFDGHADRQTDRPADVQGKGRAAAGECQLWLVGLSGADDRGHRALPS